MKWMFTYAFICLLPFSYHDLIATDWAGLTWGNIGGILYVVALATFLCYVLVVVGQKALRPTVAGMYNYIQPIVSVTASIYLGLDTFSFVKVLAVLLIFTGIWSQPARAASRWSGNNRDSQTYLPHHYLPKNHCQPRKPSMVLPHDAF